MSSSTRRDESQKVVDSVVSQVAEVVSDISGIQLGDKQRPMVESRLRSRMLKLKIDSFSMYLDYLNKNLESESQALLSLLTTHHTFFFREFNHFEFLLNKGLAKFVEKARQRKDKTIRIWSAACSKGQEVYSLAMFFRFHLMHMAPDVKFEIWGSDVDSVSVKFAKNGVYKTDELRQSPAMYLDANWVRGTGNVQNFSKAKDHLLASCHFETINLLSCEDFLKNKTFDLIFCRNVFIYFNQGQIQQITKKFMQHLDQDGFLFLGVSESLNGLVSNIETAGPSVYQHKKIQEKLVSAKTQVIQMVKPSPKSIVEKPIEVLCIDDSPVIHTLLGKILSPERGFKIGAKASNGREALEILKTKKFDAITLDMDMPELDGVGFLKEFKDRSMPIVILSSVNRDDLSRAQQAFALGASDYIEKPSSENLSQVSNEIRSKIKLILSMKKVS
jgi:chemotaxis protein methyltransferase CheR